MVVDGGYLLSFDVEVLLVNQSAIRDCGSVAWLVSPGARATGIINDVRAAIAENDFPRGAQAHPSYRAAHGCTPEMIEALSWMARGELEAKNLDAAEKYAERNLSAFAAAVEKAAAGSGAVSADRSGRGNRS